MAPPHPTPPPTHTHCSHNKEVHLINVHLPSDAKSKLRINLDRTQDAHLPATLTLLRNISVVPGQNIRKSPTYLKKTQTTQETHKIVQGRKTRGTLIWRYQKTKQRDTLTWPGERIEDKRTDWPDAEEDEIEWSPGWQHVHCFSLWAGCPHSPDQDIYARIGHVLLKNRTYIIHSKYDKLHSTEQYITI